MYVRMYVFTLHVQQVLYQIFSAEICAYHAHQICDVLYRGLSIHTPHKLP